MTRFEWKRNPNVTISSLKSRHSSFFIKKVVQKAILYIWVTVVKKYITKNLQKSPNLVVLSLYLSLYLSLSHTHMCCTLCCVHCVRSFVRWHEWTTTTSKETFWRWEGIHEEDTLIFRWMDRSSLTLCLSLSFALSSISVFFVRIVQRISDKFEAKYGFGLSVLPVVLLLLLLPLLSIFIFL